jgi:hypothetical protein
MLLLKRLLHPPQIAIQQHPCHLLNQICCHPLWVQMIQMIPTSTKNSPDAKTYPLLAHLGIPISGKSMYGALLQEIVKFNGRQSITYVQGNQTKATLLKVPPIMKEENLCKKILRKGSIIDAMISAMGSAMTDEDIDATKKSAAKCVLEFLSVKFPDETKAIVAKCGYAVPKDLKMSSEKVEAMLHALFCHLEPVFGGIFFAPEHV